MLLCVPSALLAFGAVVLNAPVAAAMSCVVFSRVFSTERMPTFGKTGLEPHVTAAEAMGMTRSALFTWHIAGANLPQIIALAGSSVSIALGGAARSDLRFARHRSARLESHARAGFTTIAGCNARDCSRKHYRGRDNGRRGRHTSGANGMTIARRLAILFLICRLIGFSCARTSDVVLV